MSNLLKTELYKLFHSWYFWGIGIFNLLLSSILLLDSKERSSNLIMASLYNIPLLYCKRPIRGCIEISGCCM